MALMDKVEVAAKRLVNRICQMQKLFNDNKYLAYPERKEFAEAQADSFIRYFMSLVDETGVDPKELVRHLIAEHGFKIFKVLRKVFIK